MEHTAIRDVMSAVGLTQGGFYRHFESKEQLAAEATENALDEWIESIRSKIEGESPTRSLQIVFSSYLKISARKDLGKSCPLAALGSEMGRSSLGVRLAAMSGHRKMIDIVSAQLVHLPDNVAASVANAMVSTMVGAVMLSQIAEDRKEAERILANAQSLLSSMSLAGSPMK
jgi:TetR/AcrR family transcriptional regulator, transcriptional repressor for nem operon